MSWWLRTLLGLDDSESLSGEHTRWELAGLPEGFLLLVATVVVVSIVTLIVVLYRRERGLSLTRRWTLTTLRVGSLVLVLIVLVNPRAVTEIHRKRSARTLVLVDVSSSMNQSDKVGGRRDVALREPIDFSPPENPTRAALTVAAVEKTNLVEELEKTNHVLIYAAGENARRLTSLTAPEVSSPSDESTRIGDSLRTTLRDAGPDPVAAVVLLSDGKHNLGEHPVDVVTDPVAWRGVPIHAVGIGESDELRNVSVVDLVAPDTVEVLYPIEIEGGIRITGVRGTVMAKLIRVYEDRREQKTIEERTINATGEPLEVRLRFIDSVPEKGSYRYRLVLDQIPHEKTTRDNRREVKILATEERRRVLLVSSNSTVEFLSVQRFFFRDKGIQVSTWLGSADRTVTLDSNVVIRRLPKTARELQVYDVVVLMDPEAAALTNSFREALVSFVTEQGGGLAYVAGEANTPLIARAGKAQMRRFVGLLPVALSDRAPQLGTGTFYTQPWRPRMTPNGQLHPICRLKNDPDENQKLQSLLHPLYFVHPSSTLRPSGLDLLRAPQGSIVAAVHQVGLGNVLYLGSDDFWRWRPQSGVHERFWAGVVRHLALGKKRNDKGHVTAETDRDRYREGDRIRVVVQMTGTKEQLSRTRGYDVVVEETGDTEKGVGEKQRWNVNLYPDANVSESSSRQTDAVGERYAGTLRAPRAGSFSIFVGKEEKTSFEVLPTSTEWQDTTPDFDLLQEIAERSGGSFQTLADLDQVPGRIPDASLIEVIGRRTAMVWDSAALMILFALLLTVEWTLRKLWNLT